MKETMSVYVGDANEVAKYIMSKVDVTQKKLHKLMYFSYVLFLTENNENEEEINNIMFKNSFQAWVHGPVLREIYSNYVGFGYREFNIESYDGDLPEEVTNSCDEIIDFFGFLDGNTLESLSHEDLSWQAKRRGLNKYSPSNELLDLKDMYLSGLDRFYE